MIQVILHEIEIRFVSRDSYLNSLLPLFVTRSIFKKLYVFITSLAQVRYTYVTLPSFKHWSRFTSLLTIRTSNYNLVYIYDIKVSVA